MAKTLKITWVKSTIGFPQRQRATIKSLGLKRLHHSVIKEENPIVWGQINKVRHLVTVEEA